MEEIIKKYWLVFLGLIFLLALFLRVYKLGEIPNGLYQDETAIGYNAYSILLTGKDEYGKHLPLYFKSFGDYKLPVYVYLTAIPVKFFGLSDVTPRVISSFFSVLSVGMIYFLIKRLTNDKKLSLISALFLAINPWHLHYGRAAFEVSVALFLFLLGSWLLIKKKLNLAEALLGAGCFIVALYSYNLTRLLAPLLLIVIVYFRKEEFLAKSKAFKSLTLTFLLVGLIPFLMSFLNPEGLSSAKGTLISSSASIQAGLLEFRSYMLYTPELFQKLFFSTYPQTAWEYLRHILSYLSVEFFFLNGSSHGNHGIGNFGLFYPIEIIFILLGIITVFKNKLIWGYLLLAWMFITILVAALTREAPHATRSFFLVVPFVTFSAYGFIEILKYIQKINLIPKISLGLVILFLSGYGIIYYFASYYVRFPIAYASKWNSEDRKVVEFLKINESRYGKIVIDSNTNLVYTSVLYYLGYNPSDFQNSVIRSKDDSEGFSKVESFGKYEFRKIDWDRDLQKANTLFITTNDNVPDTASIVAKFTYPQRPVVVNIGQDIHQFPVTDTAYVLLEKN